jgi:hypothetical protein
MAFGDRQANARVAIKQIAQQLCAASGHADDEQRPDESIHPSSPLDPCGTSAGLPTVSFVAAADLAKF